MNKYIQFKCFEIEQPIGTFYIGSIEAADLISISYADVRRIEDRDVEKYLGIQRPLSPGRVKEIAQYVNLVDSTFPTGIILSVSSKDAIFDSSKSVMKIIKAPNVAKIIDGQHRIAGLEAFNGKTFQLNVTIFIDMEIEDQAMVFATINLKHTKVSKSLAYDLFEFATSRSPQKTCHNIAKLLNSKEGSPLKGRIKILGQAIDNEIETLTQATFVECLLKYVSTDPMSDRDILKRGKQLKKLPQDQLPDLPFRNLFIDSKDAEIARILWNYFSAIEKKWPLSWSNVERGNVLNRSTGFIALMRFLKPCYVSFGRLGDIISMDAFSSIFSKVKIKDGTFKPDIYKPGSSGSGQLYREVYEQAGF